MTNWKNGIPEMKCEKCEASRVFPVCESGAINFVGGTDLAKIAGWKIWTENGSWHHLCKFHNK